MSLFGWLRPSSKVGPEPAAAGAGAAPAAAAGGHKEVVLSSFGIVKGPSAEAQFAVAAMPLGLGPPPPEKFGQGRPVGGSRPAFLALRAAAAEPAAADEPPAPAAAAVPEVAARGEAVGEKKKYAPMTDLQKKYARL